MVFEGLLDVEQVNYDRSHGDDSLIDSCRDPRCPAPLRGTSDHEPVDIYPAPRGAAAEGRNRIHGPHHTLGHREPQRPGFVSGPEVLVPAIRNDGVLRALLGLPYEGQRL